MKEELQALQKLIKETAEKYNIIYVNNYLIDCNGKMSGGMSIQLKDGEIMDIEKLKE